MWIFTPQGNRNEHMCAQINFVANGQGGGPRIIKVFGIPKARTPWNLATWNRGTIDFYPTFSRDPPISLQYLRYRHAVEIYKISSWLSAGPPTLESQFFFYRPWISPRKTQRQSPTMKARVYNAAVRKSNFISSVFALDSDFLICAGRMRHFLFWG